MQILDDFLTRIANAIRKRKQTTDLIKANNFASEIESIPQTYVSSLQEKSVTITSNGTTTLNPDTNYDGISSAEITTNVQPALQSKSTTLTSSSAISIVPDSGYYGLSKVTVTPSVQTKSQTITSNGTTTISPDSGKVGLSKVTITTNVAGGTLSVPAITNTNSDKLSKSLTLNANKTGVLVFHYVTALHWYYKISVAGTKIVERKGNQDVGVINTVASGWTSRYLHKGTGDSTSSEHTEILLIPASSSARTIAIEASSAYGGRFSWYTLIQ